MTNEDKIIDVAKYFVAKSEEEASTNPSKSLAPLKLQKLLYYAKAWNLVFNKGDELFTDEFEAWVHGPANHKIWDYFKNFDFTESHPEIKSNEFESISEQEKEILDMVWNVYGKFDGKYLEMLTHSEKPWLKAREGLNASTPSKNIITSESMKSYYEKRLKEETPA